MVKMMRMGVGALAFAAMDAFGHEAMEYIQDEQGRRGSQSLHKRRRRRSKSEQKKSHRGSKDYKLDNESDQQQQTPLRPLVQYDSEEYADLIFLVGEEPDVQRIPAHSWVLSEKSPVFRAMFKRPSVGKQQSSKRTSQESGSATTTTTTSAERFGASSLSTIQSIEEDEIDDEANHQPVPESFTMHAPPPPKEEELEQQEDDFVDGKPNEPKKVELEEILDYEHNTSKPSSSAEINCNSLVIPAIVVHEVVSENEEEDTSDNMAPPKTSPIMRAKERIIDFEPRPSSNYELPSEPLVQTTIAVNDVEGRAFDILLRYLYNETLNLQSVMTALTTLYAAHKYMCPGLAKQVVKYLRENLTEKNVLLVLQHICLYCTSTNRTLSNESDDSPITVGPSKRCRSVSCYEAAASEEACSIPTPLPTICENEEEEQQPLLDEEDLFTLLMEAEEREFDAGMVVPNAKTGKNVHCCDELLKQCLELIDREASTVLASEDVEDLDISAVNMIVCRDTLRLRKEGEIEVFAALKRWSTRECKRQRLELTSENRRRVLEGAQYLVRFLLITPEDFRAGPLNSGLLTPEEAETVLAIISAGATNNNNADFIELPDHLQSLQTIWRRPRRESASVSTRQKSLTPWMATSGFPRATTPSGSSRRGSATPSMLGNVMQDPPDPPALRGISVSEPSKSGQASRRYHHHRSNGKEKFNFIEEFFICLACIFD